MIVTATYLDLVHLYQDWSVSFAFCGGRFLILFFSTRKIMVKKKQKNNSNSFSLMVIKTLESKNITFHYLKIDYKL